MNFAPVPDGDFTDDDNPLREYSLADLEAERRIVESELDRIKRDRPDSWLIPSLEKSVALIATEISARALPAARKPSGCHHPAC